MNNINMDAELNELNMGKSLWRRAYRIRQIEEKIAKRYPEGKMRCPTHLSVGQEGVPSALAEYLTNEFTGEYTTSDSLKKLSELRFKLLELYNIPQV